MAIRDVNFREVSAEPATARLISGRNGGAAKCRRKFLRFFPRGFYDQKYLGWERNYKWETHERWNQSLSESELASLLRKRQYSEIATRAVKIESRTHLLFSFEKMAIRDAIKPPVGARAFATGLYDYLHGSGEPQAKFLQWCEVLDSLPRRQSRVLTWPVSTIFGFIAQPEKHIYLKPRVTKIAAQNYGFDFQYRSRPNWASYASLHNFAQTIRRDLRDLRPRDMIDLQSFIWVQGSDEYS